MGENLVLDIRKLYVALPEGGDRPYAVEGIDLQLRQREILCLVGESGCGKSITALAIMGLLPAPDVYTSGGEILFNGEDLLKATPERLREIRGNEISMIFQEPMTALNPLMTIGKQIDEVMRVHTTQPQKHRQQRILQFLEEVHLPDPKGIINAYPHQLSGGQRQRAMIAMALMLNPKIVIADEPTTALDVTTEAQVLKLIKEMQEKYNSAILFITHDFGVVAEIADRVAVMMREGRLAEFGEAEQVLTNPQHAYTKSLIGAFPSLVLNKSVDSKNSKEVLATKDLNKTYHTGGGIFGDGRTVHAAKNVTLELHHNETLGIVGESGSGKSTIARCIIRLIEADGGSILLDGTDIRTISKKQMRTYRRRIQMVFQDPYGSLNPRYKVGRLIAEGLIINGMDSKTAYKRTHELLELVGLDPRTSGRYPHEFSGGQRQRIAIARALALEPEILIADEPVSALDVSVQAQILRLLTDIRKRLNLSILFITHNLRVAAQVCDRIAVMHEGEIVEYGTTKEIFSDPQHPYTKELFRSIPGKNWQMPRFQI
jgi:peptide/nickel transport system ATP-binding protein